MTGKKLILLVMLVGTSYSLFAQDSKYQRIFPFDNEKFKERLEEFNQLQGDTILHLKNDSITTNLNERYSMRILEVPENKMAQMPMLSLGKDIQYTMPIKRYHNYYIPRSMYPKKDTLFRKDDLMPLHIPEEKR